MAALACPPERSTSLDLRTGVNPDAVASAAPRSVAAHPASPGVVDTALRTRSDQRLLCRAQSGEHHAERLLIEIHEPLVRQVCRGFFIANGDAGDLHQAARLGLWRAIHGWNPIRGASFQTFAMLLMRREVMMLVTASRARSQTLLNGACSLDSVDGPEDGTRRGLALAERLAAPARDAADPEEMALARERIDLILSAIPTLSPHERSSLRMTLNGMSQAEVGERLGAGAKSVNNALQRARRKLNAAR